MFTSAASAVTGNIVKRSSSTDKKGTRVLVIILEFVPVRAEVFYLVVGLGIQ